MIFRAGRLIGALAATLIDGGIVLVRNLPSGQPDVGGRAHRQSYPNQCRYFSHHPDRAWFSRYIDIIR